MKGASDFWGRAVEWLTSAQNEEKTNTDASASCAYYAALYALSALFALEGKVFSSHDGVEIVLHRDYIKTGILSKDFGKDFRTLRDLRKVGNYGCAAHVSGEDAAIGIEIAREVIEAVYRLKPDEFTRPPWMTDQVPQ